MPPKNNVFKYTSSKLDKYSNLAHGFFTRNGGVSTDLRFQSLNACNIAFGDSDNNVTTNRKIISTELGFDPKNLYTVHQVHSSEVITITKEEKDTKHLKADAIVTNLSNVLLGIKTADCVPILFYDPQANIIGAAHSGWKGAISGIIDNTLLSMQNLGASISNIICAIGPCIQQISYEVDNNFYTNFVTHNPTNRQYFIPSKNTNHFMFNLPAYCANRLENLGIQNIDNLTIDTYSNPDMLFSYRRATHEAAGINEKVEYGVQLSVIGMY